MANKAVTKEARRAARLAAAAAQDELLRRTRANVEDLAAFFTARERAEAVDEWLAERQQVLCEQAAARRSVQRVQCGRALRRDAGPRRELTGDRADGRCGGKDCAGVDSGSRCGTGSGRRGGAAGGRRTDGRGGGAAVAGVEGQPQIEELG